MDYGHRLDPEAHKVLWHEVVVWDLPHAQTKFCTSI